MTIHGLAGLPRSGSTLLGNLLAQNPDIVVSGSSPLVEVLASVSRTITSAPEVIGDLTYPSGYERHRRAMAEYGETYHNSPGKIVFDKGRLWTNEAVLMRAVYPQSVIVATVRDPRSIIASIERQHRKTGIFGSHTGQSRLLDSASAMMAPNGSVGLFLAGLEDLLARNLPNVIVVRYESFILAPTVAIDRIYNALDIDTYPHDVTAVVNNAADVDAVYRNKFPHDGSGSITADKDRGWADVIPADLAAQVAGVNPAFMQAFGYV